MTLLFWSGMEGRLLFRSQTYELLIIGTSLATDSCLCSTIVEPSPICCPRGRSKFCLVFVWFSRTRLIPQFITQHGRPARDSSFQCQLTSAEGSDNGLLQISEKMFPRRIYLLLRGGFLLRKRHVEKGVFLLEQNKMG